MEGQEHWVTTGPVTKHYTAEEDREGNRTALAFLTLFCYVITALPAIAACICLLDTLLYKGRARTVIALAASPDIEYLSTRDFYFGSGNVPPPRLPDP